MHSRVFLCFWCLQVFKKSVILYWFCCFSAAQSCCWFSFTDFPHDEKSYPHPSPLVHWWKTKKQTKTSHKRLKEWQLPKSVIFLAIGRSGQMVPRSWWIEVCMNSSSLSSPAVFPLVAICSKPRISELTFSCISCISQGMCHWWASFNFPQ